MSLNIDRCRARMGSFIQRFSIKITVGTRYYRYSNINHEMTLFFCMLLLTHGDIEANPGIQGKNIQLLFMLSMECK